MSQATLDKFSDSMSVRFIADALRYFPATILPSIFGMVAVFIYTRTFTPQQYGIYSLVLAITSPCVTLLTEWVAQPIGRFYAEYEHRGELNAFLRVVATLLVFIGLVIVFLAAVGCLFVIRAKQVAFWAFVFSGAVGAVLSQSMISVMIPILSSSLRAHLYRNIIVVGSGISTLVSLVLVHWIGANIAWLLWGQTIANILLLPFLYRWTEMAKVLPTIKFTSEIRELLSRYWRYGGPMMLWFLASGILSLEDRYVIEWLQGSGAVGMYSVNYNLISNIGNILNSPVILAVGPILYYQWGRQRFTDAAETLARMTELYVILGVAMIGGTIVVGVPLVKIVLGTEFWPGAVVLIPVIIGRVFWGASVIGHKSLELGERTMSMAMSALAAAVINILGNFIFVPWYGYIAAAYTTLFSYAVYACIIWWQSKRNLPWRVSIRFISLYCVIAIGDAALVKWILFIMFGGNRPIIELCIGSVMYLLVFITSIGLFLSRRIVFLVQFSRVRA